MQTDRRPPPRTRRPTQADVARRAAVSQTVVSYVLNDDRSVSIAPETRRRVLDAIAALGYVPDDAARSLRSRRTLTIAAVIPDITNPFYPAFIRGVQDVAGANGYDLIAYNTDGTLEGERRGLDTVRRGRVDGLIINPFHLDPGDILPILTGGTPVVINGEYHLDAFPSDLPLDRVYVPGDAAARSLVEFLISQGHTRIGMIAGEDATPPREGRVRGYRQALATHHIPLEEALIRGGGFTEAGGYEAMRELLALRPRFTAVFAANDLMALGAFIACRERGIRVPADIAIAGFDDIPAARLVSPALTTVAQFPERTGRHAAEQLMDRLGGRYTGPTRLDLLQHKLIVRESA